jgi:hypothetical protein
MHFFLIPMMTITEEEEGWKQVERLLTTSINLAEDECSVI